MFNNRSEVTLIFCIATSVIFVGWISDNRCGFKMRAPNIVVTLSNRSSRNATETTAVRFTRCRPETPAPRTAQHRPLRLHEGNVPVNEVLPDRQPVSQTSVLHRRQRTTHSRPSEPQWRPDRRGLFWWTLNVVRQQWLTPCRCSAVLAFLSITASTRGHWTTPFSWLLILTSSRFIHAAVNITLICCLRDGTIVRVLLSYSGWSLIHVKFPYFSGYFWQRN